MTIKCAYRRNCRLLDNDNYNDWRRAMHDKKVRSWLETHQDLLQMRYYFDTGLGTFDTLDGNLPAARLAPQAKAPAAGLSLLPPQLVAAAAAAAAVTVAGARPGAPSATA